MRPSHLLIAAALVAVAEAYRLPARVGARTRGPAQMSALAEDDIASALADPQYAMDISSITEGSERETYIGQGSGVNEGTGMGKLATWAKGLVGKVLTRKNRPVYEALGKIIEDDLLAMVKEYEPTLEQRRTWFTEPGAAPATHTFTTDDGKCEASVAGYKGGRIDWITTCKFFSSELGFGNLRIDGWANRETRAPHVAVHLCIVFNVLFIYIGCPPRTNLVLDDAYNDFVYGTDRDSIGGSHSTTCTCGVSRTRSSSST